MATVDMTLATQRIDMRNASTVEFDTLNSKFGTQWSWTTPDGHDIDLNGTGLTYDADGRALTGNVTSIAIDLGDNNFSEPDVFITRIDAPANTLDDSAGSFWSFLSGDDTFLGPLLENGGSGFSAFFGDAFRAPARAAEGGDDLFRAGDTAIQVVGDVFDVNTAAAFTGGNDRVFGAPTELAQGLLGDALTVQGTGVLIGGDDIMAIRSVNALSFAFGDAATVHGFGGLAKVAGGSDRITAENGSAAQLSGDVGTVVQSALVTGGDDTIDGSERGEAISGDVFKTLTSSGIEIAGGNDTLRGRGGNDIISGDVHVALTGVLITGGNDVIHGGEGDDTIFGEVAQGAAVTAGGNDTLFGDAGNDRLSGQSGNDMLEGGAGDDTLDGGAGSDTVTYAEATSGATIDLRVAFQTATGGLGNDTLIAVENAVAGSFADKLVGNAGANALEGGGGADTVFGLEGNDTLRGGDGNDLMNAGAGDDKLFGGDGGDAVFAGDGNDTLNGEAGDDRIDGGANEDTLFGDAGADIATGGAGNDRIEGGEGDDKLLGGDAGIDTILGGAGGDRIAGGDGDDARLDGGSGIDVITGDAGNDRIDAGADGDRLLGGLGLDVLTGGLGGDLFEFVTLAESAPGSGRDQFTDFAVDPAGGAAFVDRIHVSRIDAAAGVAGDQAFAFIGAAAFGAEGQIRAIQSGADTLVQFNTAGAGGAEMEILLRSFTATALTAADFVL